MPSEETWLANRKPPLRYLDEVQERGRPDGLELPRHLAQRPTLRHILTPSCRGAVSSIRASKIDLFSLKDGFQARQLSGTYTSHAQDYLMPYIRTEWYRDARLYES